MNDTSILDLAINYSNIKNTEFDDVYDSCVGINTNGEKVEYFIKDLLCDSLSIDGKDKKEQQHKEKLSWLGSKNHPPDMMIRDGEAIEVKKFRGKHQKLSLNSSTPKTHITPDMKRINSDCEACEDEIGGWDKKDMVYALASDVSSGSVGFTWVLYGDCWCSKNKTYKDVTDSIRESLEDSLPKDVNLDMSGNELGKVKDVGEGGGELRIRPMWSIEHPANKFKKYIDKYKSKITNSNPLFMVMKRTKFKQSFESISSEDKDILLSSDNTTLTQLVESDPTTGEDEKFVIIEVGS